MVRAMVAAEKRMMGELGTMFLSVRNLTQHCNEHVVFYTLPK